MFFWRAPIPQQPSRLLRVAEAYVVVALFGHYCCCPPLLKSRRILREFVEVDAFTDPAPTWHVLIPSRYDPPGPELSKLTLGVIHAVFLPKMIVLD